MSHRATSNDSDDSEVSLHSDASDSPKARKQKKKRSAFKDYFSKQIESSVAEQEKNTKSSYTESLLRKRFKRLIKHNETVQSPKVSFINAGNHSGSDDENSVKTIFPDKPLQIELDTAEIEKKDSPLCTESEVHSVDDHEDIEPGIDALDEINPVVTTQPAEVIQTVSNSSSYRHTNDKPQQPWLCPNHRYVTLSIFLVIIVFSSFLGAPLYFITLLIGMMAPVCVKIISEKVVEVIKKKLYVKGDGPEKSKFSVPNYAAMNILEVPSAEEFQVPKKTYEGWINLYPHTSYDPETYHLSDTIPVYIKIKDNHLSVFHTKNRIPKRSMYNEPVHKLNPTSSSMYSLRNAKVSLLPEGLAKVRHWSKKYPICVQIENSSAASGDVKNDDVFCSEAPPTAVTNTVDQPASEKEDFQDDDLQEYSDSTATNNTFQDDEFKDVEDYDENNATCTRNSTSTLGDEIELNAIAEAASGLTEAAPHLRIFLFARGNREKYDWFLRLHTTIQSLSRTDGEGKEQSLNIKDEFQTAASDNQNSDQTSLGTAADTVSDAKTTLAVDKQQDVATGGPDTTESSHSIRSAAAASPGGKTSACGNTAAVTTGGDFELVNAEENESGAATAATAADGTKSSGSQHSLLGNRQYLKYMGHFLQGDHKDDPASLDAAWKDFNFTISSDVLWFNVLAGRVLLGVLSDPGWSMRIQERIQKKLSTLKLPYFIDELECSELSLGESPPMIHRASRPVLDDRGLWVDLDVTYEGLVTLVLSTKLNLMKLKRLNNGETAADGAAGECAYSKSAPDPRTYSAVYNSDLEDSADSSTSDDNSSTSSMAAALAASGSQSGAQDAGTAAQDKTFSMRTISPTPRKQSANKSFLKVVDQVAASKFFQQAAEYKYVKKALVAVSNSQLRLELNFRGLVGELVLNIPNPPSDRLWFAFRKPPRLWLSVHPAFGERNVTFAYVTRWIEKKICQELVKNLVLPNMEDLIVPILVPTAQPTATRHPT